MMYVGYSKIAYLTLFKKTCNAFMDDLRTNDGRKTVDCKGCFLYCRKYVMSPKKCKKKP